MNRHVKSFTCARTGRPRLRNRRLSATLAGPIQPLLEWLARQRVALMLVEESNLEDAFLELYGPD